MHNMSHNVVAVLSFVYLGFLLFTYVNAFRLMKFLKENNCGCLENHRSWILRNLSIPLLAITLVVNLGNMFFMNKANNTVKMILSVLSVASFALFVAFMVSLYTYTREIDEQNCQCLKRVPDLHKYLQKASIAMIVVFFTSLVAYVLFFFFMTNKYASRLENMDNKQKKQFQNLVSKLQKSKKTKAKSTKSKK